MSRTRTGKRLELTARDIAIFKLLRQYRYLRSSYIHAFVGGASVTRLKERLGDLYHEGYLDRPNQQWEFADARYQPAVHEIGAGARRALGEAGTACEGERTFLGHTAHRQFLHSLMICEALASIELAVRSNPALRLIGWPEILGRAPEDTCRSPTPYRLPVPSGGYLMPDGLFGIEYKAGSASTYRFFALEADRGTMPVARSNPNQTSYLGKLAMYRDALDRRTHKTHWGISTLLVLTVTTSESRAAEMRRRLCAEAGNNAGFLFKTVTPDALRNSVLQLLTDPWERAGFPPLSIAESD